MTGNCRSGFSLIELLVAIFVLAMAVAGAVAVIMTAGRSAAGARDKLLAEQLGRTAQADAAYCAERDMVNCDVTQVSPTEFTKHDPRIAPAAGWLWRAHSFDPAIGAYSLDVWVFRNPTEPSVSWGSAPDSVPKRQQTLLYLQSKLETRRP